MKRGSQNAAICLKLTSELLKEAIRFAKLVDHGYECIPGWQFCRTYYDNAQKIKKNVVNEKSPSENGSTQINSLDSTTTDYSTSDIDSDEQENNQEIV